MTNDPIRQADSERRLGNLAEAPRCGARTRTGSPCRLSCKRASTLSDARWRERLGRTVGCSQRQFQAWPLDTRE